MSILKDAQQRKLAFLGGFRGHVLLLMSYWIFEKGQPLPKFGEWDVNDPASAEGFTVIFNKARDEKKTGGKPESPAKADPHAKPRAEPGKTQPKKWFCCIQTPAAK
ncbi:protein NOI4-like isoform X1 [Hibiscus syriacus]|uniref:protein NOI4-like isoform X1 n=1 Tax=Hibiscus syriacus TaxID=106335 RepID=UPI00192172E1|nr:protein NOI4-like isoform X1 [Hibiscus syriacus]